MTEDLTSIVRRIYDNAKQYIPDHIKFGCYGPVSIMHYYTLQSFTDVLEHAHTINNFQYSQIIVDDHLRAVSDPKGRIYALGDCAQVQGQALPCTAQAAERQGRYLAKALDHIALPEGPEPEPFVFKPWGMLAYVGGYKAIHDLPVDKSKGAYMYMAIHKAVHGLPLIKGWNDSNKKKEMGVSAVCLRSMVGIG